MSMARAVSVRGGGVVGCGRRARQQAVSLQQ